MPKETMGGVAALGVALNLGGDKATHNVEKLLEALRDVRGGGGGGKAEADARAAIVALETFFSERLGKGELRVAGTKAAALDASAMKRAEWLGRQYKLFLKRLCALVAGGGGGGRHRHRGDDGGDDTFEPVSPRTTTLALAATMECARSEHPGTFAADPWVNALRAATTGDAFTPELLGAMSSRYFSYADARYHAYQCVVKLCEETRAKAAAKKRGRREEDREREDDVARCVYDVLANLPREFDDFASGGDIGAKPAAGGDEENFEAMLGLMKGGDIGGDVEERRDEEKAWCLGLSVGEAAAAERAADAAKAAGARRKETDAAVAAATATATAARKAAAKTSPKWKDGKRHRRLFADAWLAFLRTPMPPDIYRKTLTSLHDDVIPHLPNPQLLSDFCTHSIDRGGLDGMLALNGIFVLMTKHGLEYPAFYAKLYGLLTPEAFHARGRGGFFELLDVFLKSSALPGYLAAAFIKRLARLALRAPPAGAMTCVAFAHNLLRRHPGCAVLVHRGPTEERASAAEGALASFASDPYSEREPDPAKCDALKSSLWELKTLAESHYHPQVVKLVKMIQERDLSDRVKTKELPVKALCAASYASLVAEELDARVKTAALAHHGSRGLSGLFASRTFAECGIGGGGGGDGLVFRWRESEAEVEGGRLLEGENAAVAAGAR